MYVQLAQIALCMYDDYPDVGATRIGARSNLLSQAPPGGNGLVGIYLTPHLKNKLIDKS